MNIIWDGFVRSERQDVDELLRRHSLADAARKYDWVGVSEILHEHGELTNTTRPGGTLLFAPLHQAAHGGAPIEVVSDILRKGAWRTLQNSRGERPIDVAERQGHMHLLPMLAPVLRRKVPYGVLTRMQEHFHKVVLGRAEQQVREFGMRLPELEPLLEYQNERFWFAVPGMYGGFSYWLEADGVEAILISESWCRVVGGSGQRHRITSAGSRLMDEGFV